MNPLILLSVACAAVMYGLLIKSLLYSGTEQNMATWGLWGLLDLVTAASIYMQGGNWALVSFYVLGSLVICTVLGYKRQFHWTGFESFIVGLVLICLAVWYKVGVGATTIAGTTAVAIAGLPQLRDSIRRPDPSTVNIWIGFTLANLFSTLAAESWAVAEWLYPGVCTVLTVLLVLANRRKAP